MLSLLRSLGLAPRKTSPTRKKFTPSLDMLEGRVTPAIIATYSASTDTIRISLTSTGDTATIEKTDTASPTVTYSITNNNDPLTPVTVPIVGYSPNDPVVRIVVSDGSSGGSATGQKISFTSNTTEIYNLSAGLSITGIESVEIESAVDSVATNGISITGASTGITLGANLTTTGGASMRFDGPVILSGNVTVNANSTSDGDIEFTSTINSASTGGPFDLTIDAGSAIVTLAGNLGSTESLDTISVTGGAISLNGNVAGDGDITFTGPTTLKRNTIVNSTGGASSTINFAGTISSDSSSTPRSLTVGTGGASPEAGDAAFGGALGTSILKLGSVIINRTGTTTLNGNIDTSNAPVSFRGPVELNANVTISTGTTKGTVTFLDDLNSASTTAQSLTINAGSAAVSLKAVGNTNELGNTSITAGTINLEGDIETDNGAISLSGAVIIKGGNRTLSSKGGAITLGTASPLAGTVNGDTAGTRELTLNAGNGGIIVNALVGNLRRLQDFTISDADDVNINNSITATTISITADGGTDGRGNLFFNNPTSVITGATTITSNATVNSDIDVSARFAGTVDIFGPDKTDSRLRATSNSNFTVTGTDVTDRSKGSLTKTQPGRPAVITFQNIDSLFFTGGSSGNAFTLNEWFFPAEINGAGGTDILTVNRAQDATTGLKFTLDNNNLEIDAPVGAFSPVSIDYTLTSIESANIVAGAGDDTFDIGGWSGRANLAGGSGADTLIWLASANSTLTSTSFVAGSLNASLSSIESADLENKTINSIFSISGFAGSVSITGVSSSTVTATYNANFSLIGTSNTVGTITTSGTTIDFTAGNVSLIGGNRDNTFSLNGTYLGVVNLDGGAGNDIYNITLPASGGSQVVTVTDSGTSSRDTIIARSITSSGLLARTSTLPSTSGTIAYAATPQTFTTFPRISFSGIEIVTLL